VTHDERLELARELTRRLLARHGEGALVAVGVHGSVARGDDGDGSDLDIAVVTAGPQVEVPDRFLAYQGTVVDLATITADAYLEEAGVIGPAWPLAADQYLNQLALHDPGGFFHKLRHVHEAAVEQAGPEPFLAAAGYDLVQLLAFQAKAEAAELTGDLPGALVAVKQAAVLAALVVGLLARTPYRNLADALRATAATTAVPGGFAAAYRTLLDPAAPPAAQVLALGRASAALAAEARARGVPFEAADLDAFV
jgi:predicted nucleotidyltransferase